MSLFTSVKRFGRKIKDNVSDHWDNFISDPWEATKEGFNTAWTGGFNLFAPKWTTDPLFTAQAIAGATLSGYGLYKGTLLPSMGLSQEAGMAPSAFYNGSAIAGGVSTTDKLLLSGLTLSGLYNMYQGNRNYELQKEYSEKNQQLQEEQFNYQQWLNNHQVGLGLSQYQQAGINPMSATSQTFSAGAGVTPVNAPQYGDYSQRLFDSLVSQRMQRRELQNQRDIVASQNSVSLYGTLASLQNQSNISNFEQSEITKRQLASLEQDKFIKLADMAMNNKHFSFEQKKDILQSIAKMKESNQLSRVEYTRNVEALKQDVAKTFELYKSGHTTKQGFLNNIMSFLDDSKLRVNDLSRQEAKSFLDFLEEEEKGSTTYKEFQTNVMKYVLEHLIEPYEDVNTQNLEDLLKALD